MTSHRFFVESPFAETCPYVTPGRTKETSQGCPPLLHRQDTAIVIQFQSCQKSCKIRLDVTADNH